MRLFVFSSVVLMKQNNSFIQRGQAVYLVLLRSVGSFITCSGDLEKDSIVYSEALFGKEIHH